MKLLVLITIVIGISTTGCRSFNIPRNTKFYLSTNTFYEIKQLRGRRGRYAGLQPVTDCPVAVNAKASTDFLPVNTEVTVRGSKDGVNFKFDVVGGDLTVSGVFYRKYVRGHRLESYVRRFISEAPIDLRRNTTKELLAIGEGKVFIGMTQEAIRMSWGEPFKNFKAMGKDTLVYYKNRRYKLHLIIRDGKLIEIKDERPKAAPIRLVQ